MANGQIISTPTLLVNNEQIEYIPNSLSYRKGSGDRSVHTQIAGNGSTTVVVSENAESAKSSVKFDVYTTKDHVDFLGTILDKIGEIGIQIADDRTGLSETFEFMTLMSEPEITVQNGGKLQLNFEGARAA